MAALRHGIALLSVSSLGLALPFLVRERALSSARRDLALPRSSNFLRSSPGPCPPSAAPAYRRRRRSGPHLPFLAKGCS